MEYKTGYVAFVDILGFSSYVSNELNGQRTSELFRFVKNFCYLFNSSKELETEVSFFSDSIVLTTNNIENLVPSILLAERYLQDHLGLLFRGGISYGKYHHMDGVTFGPAVVSAYQLEKSAVYSRIVVDKSITISSKYKYFYFEDIDGYRCLNPLATTLNEIQAYGDEEVSYPPDIADAIMSIVKMRRKEIIDRIHTYKGSSVVEKYTWRVRPFNYMCREFSNIPIGTMLYEDAEFTVDSDFQNFFKEQQITEKDILSHRMKVPSPQQHPMNFFGLKTLKDNR